MSPPLCRSPPGRWDLTCATNGESARELSQRTATGFVPERKRSLRRSRRAEAPARAAVNSQGRKPLDQGNRTRKALEGRETERRRVSPLQGFTLARDSHQGDQPLTVGARPWLFTAALPGLLLAKPGTKPGPVSTVRTPAHCARHPSPTTEIQLGRPFPLAQAKARTPACAASGSLQLATPTGARGPFRQKGPTNDAVRQQRPEVRCFPRNPVTTNGLHRCAGHILRCVWQPGNMPLRSRDAPCPHSRGIAILSMFNRLYSCAHGAHRRAKKSEHSVQTGIRLAFHLGTINQLSAPERRTS
jgi:hypothetical protein